MWWLLACSPDYTVLHEDTAVEAGPTMVVDAQTAVEERLDILFVMDTSSSMGPEHTQLTDNVESLLAPLLSDDFATIDWRVGVSRATPGDLGAVGWVIYEDYPDTALDIIKMFIASMYTTCSDPSCEMGFDAAQVSNIYDTEHRRDADQLIIFVSDEHEQSRTTNEQYLEASAQFRDRPYITLNAAITNLESKSDCTGWQVEQGVGYLDVADIAVDFCDEKHWGDTLTVALDHVTNINKVFDLKYEPLYPADIHVLWDGIDLAANWRYSGGSIIFDIAPSPGTDLVFLYQTLDRVLPEDL